jgi:hypothetical protein
MSLGRKFPLRSPYRTQPYDPMVPGDTDRLAPLPFQVGSGAVDSVETTLVLRILLQSVVSEGGDGGDGGGGGGGGTGTGADCNPITNQYCVPSGAITRASYPTAVVSCKIT